MFRVSQFLCICYCHLEFPYLGYSKQFYHILFSPPTQNLLLQSSFSASLVPIPAPAQRLRFGWPIADIVRFRNSFTYLCIGTYMSAFLCWWQFELTTTSSCCTRVSGYHFVPPGWCDVTVWATLDFKESICLLAVSWPPPYAPMSRIGTDKPTNCGRRGWLFIMSRSTLKTCSWTYPIMHFADNFGTVTVRIQMQNWMKMWNH